MSDNEDINHLIQIAKQEIAPAKYKKFLEKKQKAYSALNEAQRFCLSMEIFSGSKRVLFESIWEAYEKWASSPIPKSKFLEQFSALYMRKQQDEHIYFCLNRYPWDVILDAAESAAQNEKNKIFK